MGIIFTSCNTGSSSDVSAVDSTVVPASAKLPASGSDTGETGPINPQQNAIPITLNGSATNTIIPSGTTIPVTTPQVTATTASTTTAPGMNPPHGQPGHRCDINVGAPLNSKPNPTATATEQPIQASITQPATTKTTPVQTAVTATPVAATPTAPGMNPPHGQPNHRCDIAVGAPLNSKPAATPAITQTPVQQPAQSNMNVTPAGTTTFTPAGMNPPHGQPNHRCDIAVGAPLSSAPAVKKDTVAHN